MFKNDQEWLEKLKELRPEIVELLKTNKFVNLHSIHKCIHDFLQEKYGLLLYENFTIEPVNSNSIMIIPRNAITMLIMSNIPIEILKKEFYYGKATITPNINDIQTVCQFTECIKYRENGQIYEALINHGHIPNQDRLQIIPINESKISHINWTCLDKIICPISKRVFKVGVDVLSMPRNVVKF